VRRKASLSDWLRWLAVVAIVGVGGASAVTGHWQTCKAITPNVGRRSVEYVCEQPTVTDLPVLALLIVLLLLLLPDLAEITLPGGLVIKRRLDAQQSEIEAQQARQDLLEQRLTFMVQAQVSQASAFGNVVSLEGLREMVDDVATTRVRLRELELASGLSGVPDTMKAQEAVHEQEIAEEIGRLSQLELHELQREVVRRWRLIAPLVRLADSARLQLEGYPQPPDVAQRLEAIVDDDRSRLINWRDAYGESIRAVNEARRAIVSDPESVNAENLAIVAALSGELEESARELGLL